MHCLHARHSGFAPSSRVSQVPVGQKATHWMGIEDFSVSVSVSQTVCLQYRCVPPLATPTPFGARLRWYLPENW